MIVRDHGEGGRWYVVAVHYPSALQAKRAWERAERKLNMGAGDGGIGLMRLDPRAGGGPEGRLCDGYPVVGVTLDEAAARKCERVLRDGVTWTPTDGFADAVIARRARVLLDAQRERRGATGRLVIRRPEDRGATLDRRGRMHEPEPGRG